MTDQERITALEASLRQADSDNDQLRRERDDARRECDALRDVVERLVPTVYTHEQAKGLMYVICGHCRAFLYQSTIAKHLATHADAITVLDTQSINPLELWGKR